MKTMMKNKTEGVSLIMAIIFVSAFMLVLADLAEVQISVIRSISLRRMSAQIMYLAQSAEELGLGASEAHLPGWNSAGDADTDMAILSQAAESIGFPLKAASISVVGRSTSQIRLNGTPYYSAPAAYFSNGKVRATGDAGECAPADPVEDNAANKACHWNRLYVGESVEIPLYYDGGNESPDFSGAGAKFALRVRAPCDIKGFKSEEGCERIKLFPKAEPAETAYRDIKKDPVLVQWTISGTEVNEVKTLIAKDGKENNQKRHSNLVNGNTELSAGRINLAVAGPDLFDSIVLQKDFQGTKISIQKTEATIKGFIDGNLSKPVLRLSLVTQPTRAKIDQDDDGDMAPAYHPSKDANDYRYFIPFLEYQLLTQGPIPSDSKSTIAGAIESKDFRREFQVYRKHAPTLGGFVLESL